MKTFASEVKTLSAVQKHLMLYINACGPVTLAGCTHELRTQCVEWDGLSDFAKDCVLSDAINAMIRGKQIEIEVDISTGEISLDCWHGV